MYLYRWQRIFQIYAYHTPPPPPPSAPLLSPRNDPALIRLEEFNLVAKMPVITQVSYISISNVR